MDLTKLSPKNQNLLRLSSLFWTSMDWLYPPYCCNCDSKGKVICDDCFSQIEIIKGNVCRVCGYPIEKKHKVCADCIHVTPPYTQMQSWASFNGPIKKAIHALKYRQNLILGKILAEPLIEIIKKSDWSVDLVVPIPLSYARLRQRGYNQSALIARNLALRLNLAYSNEAVRRIKNTETQISLDVNKRFMNLKDAFYANPAKLKNRNVVLIDDVITTGATMQNCSLALIKAGVEKVYCLSIARAILHHSK